MTPPAVQPLVLTGAVALLGGGCMSGIDKKPAPGPWRIDAGGLRGDAQADLAHHGGPEKALHHYAFDHYAAWRAEIGPAAPLATPGAFGENLSTKGWTEDNVYLGDIVEFGTALLQVSQGRQPCWKLNRRFGVADMARRVQKSGRAGWYYRVLADGIAKPGDRLILAERPCPDWPLSRLNRLLYLETGDRTGLFAMAELAPLAQGWRRLARRRLENGRVESWDMRLEGPATGGEIATGGRSF
ncbi:MOSC domain-containing protein [Methylocystis sp. IM3]|uniref:MOSC domain-containing protein n=1 Tax=unclassified Methylocystis TaxID=2625913 RepID=UPI0030F58307